MYIILASVFLIIIAVLGFVLIRFLYPVLILLYGFFSIFKNVSKIRDKFTGDEDSNYGNNYDYSAKNTSSNYKLEPCPKCGVYKQEGTLCNCQKK